MKNSILHPFFLLYCLFAFIPFLAAEDGGDWNIRQIPLESVNVTAHRGAGDLAPENALPSLELTWNLGVCDTVPEVDIRTTQDGVLAMFHDGNFRRILPDAPEEIRNKRLEDLTWAEARQLDIGAFRGEKFRGQRIVSLAEICEALRQDPKRKIYIDVKNVDFAQLARETEGLHRQIIFTTGNYDDLARWKELVPDSDGFFWMGLGAGDDKLAPVIERLKANHFAHIDRMQIHVHFDRDGQTTPSEKFLRETAAYVHTHYPQIEIQMMPWALPDGDKKEYYWKLCDLGASGFGTDRPDLCIEALREYYEQ